MPKKYERLYKAKVGEKQPVVFYDRNLKAMTVCRQQKKVYNQPVKAHMRTYVPRGNDKDKKASHIRRSNAQIERYAKEGKGSSAKTFANIDALFT